MVMLGAGKGQWQVGAESSDHPGFVHKSVSLLCGGNVYSTVCMTFEGKCY